MKGSGITHRLASATATVRALKRIVRPAVSIARCKAAWYTALVRSSGGVAASSSR